MKVKASIDKMYVDLRKRNAVACFELSGGYSDNTPGKTAGTVVEYLKPEHTRDCKTSQIKSTDHKVAVVAKRSSNERAARAEKRLSGLMPDTPEALAAFEAAVEAHAKVKEAMAVYREAFARIPRLSLSDISELKRIADTEAEAEKGGEE